MKQFVIGKNDAGQRADRFLAKAVPLLPPGLAYKYLRIKRIKRGGARLSPSDRLVEGDVIELYINDEFFSKPEGPAFLRTDSRIRIAYEDGNILVADKPAELLCHSGGGEDTHTLINKILRYLYEKGEYSPDAENSFAPALCNRIDRNTSGLVIAAKNAEALREMCEAIKERRVRKFYKCAVFGVPSPPEGELRGYITKDAASNTVKVSREKTPGALSAVSRYSTLKTRDGLSLLQVELVTGRTHQIRAQFAAAGHPLLGDTKYGRAADSRPYGRDRQALCACKIVFGFPDHAGLLGYLDGAEIRTEDPEFEKTLF